MSGDYPGVDVCDLPEPMGEILIDAYCCRCGFKQGWKVVLGNATVNRRDFSELPETLERLSDNRR